MKKDIEWEKLGFEYINTGKYIRMDYKDGQWSDMIECSDPVLNLHAGATCIHYGQSCFEGLKAFTMKDGRVACFRPDKNGERLAASAERLMMKAPTVDVFLKAVNHVVNLNMDWVPPFGTRASLYIRPFIIGTSPRVGVKPSEEFSFYVMTMPVGPYYKTGFNPVKAYVQTYYDRAAPHGVGDVKAAGNYAAGMKPDFDIKGKGYPISLYLDAAEKRYVDEFGTSNFIGIMDSENYLTPDSSSILPSITNMSLQQIASDMGYSVEKRRIDKSELPDFDEVGACGTAAVITPVGSITLEDQVYTYCNGSKAGPVMTKLYETIRGIQDGLVEDKYNWMQSVE